MQIKYENEQINKVKNISSDHDYLVEYLEETNIEMDPDAFSYKDDDTNSYLDFFECSELPEEIFDVSSNARSKSAKSKYSILSNYGNTELNKSKQTNTTKSNRMDDKIKIIATGTVEFQDGNEVMVEGEIPVIKKNLSEPIQDDDGGFLCPYCNVKFEENLEAKKHITEKHESGRKKNKNKFQLCYVCGQTFSNYSTYKDHHQKHFPELLFYCRFCNKGFSCEYYRTEHEKIHTNDKPYQCDQCGSSFIKQSHFKVSSYLQMIFRNHIYFFFNF